MSSAAAILFVIVLWLWLGLLLRLLLGLRLRFAVIMLVITVIVVVLLRLGLRLGRRCERVRNVGDLKQSVGDLEKRAQIIDANQRNNEIHLLSHKFRSKR